MAKFKIVKLTTENAKKIEDKLKLNGGFCPCAIIHNKDTRCMCKEFRELNTSGVCHCGLYVKQCIEEEW